jgi:opacity protein-like surface antigen
MLSLGATAALADTPWYVGGGLGLTDLNQDLDVDPPADNIRVDNDFDGLETGYSLFAGYEITPRWAVELGYIDFGKADDGGLVTVLPPELPPGFDPLPPVQTDIKTDLEFTADGWYANAQYHIPIGDMLSFDLSGGWILGDSRTKLKIPGNPTLTESHNDSAFIGGVALTVKATDKIYVRSGISYSNLDFDGVIDNPYRFSLDLIYDF